MLILGQTLTNLEGKDFPMSGILPFHASKGDLQVGYRNLFGIRDSLLVRKGDILKGHEFHRWSITYKGIKDNTKVKTIKAKEKFLVNSTWEIEGWSIERREEGWANNFLHASWIHLHWASNSHLLRRWREITTNNHS